MDFHSLGVSGLILISILYSSDSATRAVTRPGAICRSTIEPLRTSVRPRGTELASDQLHVVAAKAYLEARQQGQTALLIAPTWAEIEAVTERIRNEPNSSGTLVGEEKDFQVFDSLSWTEAQKRDARQYRPGMALRFHWKKGG